MNKWTLFACAVVIALPEGTTIAADNWPQFRGPGALGAAENPALPDRWTERENVRWKADLPGRGWSSPVVWDNKVLITSVVSDGETETPERGLYFGGERVDVPQTTHRFMVYCLDLDSGDLLWQREAYAGPPRAPKHVKNTYASATPVTDGERLVVYFGNLGVFCYDLDGELQWQKELPVVKVRAGWGEGASPAMDDQRVYIVNDNEEQSYLLALDKRTGEELWRVERDDKSNWATPLVWQNELRTEIVVSGSGNVRSYDVEGNLLWHLGKMSDTGIPTPFAAGGLLYLASGQVIGKEKPLVAVRPGASGDITPQGSDDSSPYIAWRQPTGSPYNPSPLLYGDYLYVVLDGGFFACFDAHTGEVVYSKKRLPDGRAFTASPFAYNGRVFCLNEFGQTFVIKAGPEFEILHVNPLDEEAMCLASPAIVDDMLLVRTATALYCIQQGQRRGDDD